MGVLIQNGMEASIIQALTLEGVVSNADVALDCSGSRGSRMGQLPGGATALLGCLKHQALPSP